ncbi:two component, sigma54 specific, transcriptional regulator, Fis family [Malonomonas rubra DSM 5091]|uniref:Two component, sigma54 specific, transcriptional regulator, Fis family n=1 Tax=Malonomonas rubra DSM 5091 TaxID=1122189 RepID=A0A1M6HCX1_MALRU|nr:sigma-54 dependent transcriptional regulator [Malonomonas rubra]SHJ20014.1 two component, sigma54 specific, transcriptional regulator, Fis family [Malonomonas rubra DSM 5091]
MAEQFQNILIIDDEKAMRHMLRLVLEPHQYRVTEAANGVEALTAIERERFDVILSDIRMPDMDGLSFLDQPQVRNLDSTIIMMSAYGSVDTALDCMKRGAYDYISKPFKPDEVLLTLRKAEERQQLRMENQQLKTELSKQGQSFTTDRIVHSGTEMQQILQLVKAAANADSPVLISGETGTGKELIARALHGESDRTGEFLAINCSAIASGLLESELFGHMKGAFTGADREKQGLFSIASGGTLFLDEIAELPLDLQPKLLRVLQEGEVRKVGATKAEKVNTRVVAAAGRDLHEAVEKNQFRSDLYYRLAVVDINLPPLRQRPEDIILLAEYFLGELCRKEGRQMLRLSEQDKRQLTSYQWPGNIRELQNYLEKALIFSSGETLELPPLRLRQDVSLSDNLADFSLKEAAQRLEKEYIRKALDRTGGNRTKAAQILEISLRSLMYKVKEYGID